jgi:transcriptional regulator with XRE-family HTH domain
MDGPPAPAMVGRMNAPQKNVGEHIREWRTRRRMSQMDLALEAEISTRHLSFLETGRAQPSREMVLHLADQLEVPLRERNVILVAAGFAPVFPERSLDSPELASARRAVDVILKAHEPYPALVVDLRWNLVAANAAAMPLLDGVDPELLSPQVNVIRASLHPKGLAPRIANLGEWHAHALERLRRQAELTADPGLIALIEEIRSYPKPPAPDRRPEDFGNVAIPFQLMMGDTLLSMIGTTTVFGTPVDITLSELTLETFFPADAQTAEILRMAHEARQAAQAA